MPPPEREPSASRRSPSQRAASLGDALAWLDRHVNLEAIERGVGGRAAAPDLGRIRVLLSALGEPQRDYPIVHVTGTNGKGSTTRMTAALLGARGLSSVGIYTSPHLEVLNERIAVDGEPIGDEELAAVLSTLARLEPFLLERGALGAPLTWFELVTAAAFGHFADVAVQAAVVEVGLGGRYDATNSAQGTVAVVTNVELDHVEILGPTRAHIAAEKAGIIKEGSIVVVGEEDPDLVEIFAAEARLAGADALWRKGTDFACRSNRIAHGGRVLDLTTPNGSYQDVFIPLHGPHQGENAACALAAAEAFFGGPLSEEVVVEGFANVAVPGRLEVLARHPLVIVDGAHNVAGAQALGNALAEDFEGPGRLFLVMGCLRGRDPSELLEAIGPERCALVAACRPSSPRAQPAEAVKDAAERLGIDSVASTSVTEALERARSAAGDGDLIVVTGSLYVVGEARTLLRHAPS